jgi:poly-gamma-glutamate capsule biosynthesis protein CapA/YwtB (metallophosphatase superfamily)
VASIHWGSNWGYDIPKEWRHFAHGLIDEAGFDVIHATLHVTLKASNSIDRS